MNTWIPTKFHFYSTSLSKGTVRLILQHFLWSQYSIPLQSLELYRLSWLNPFSKAFIKIYYFQKFPCNGLSKMTGCSTTFNKFSLQNLLNHKWYGLFFKGCLKIPKLLPGSQKDSLIKNWGICGDKRFGSFSVRPNHTILKGMDAG